MKDNDSLEMKFDPNVINHLGIQMYSTLPPVIAELVANSFDAEANDVTIYLIDKNDKKIVIEDNGHGMNFNEINNKFLKIGRNRTIEEDSKKSKNGKRFVIGKKGIGKLSFFGIARNIFIKTYQNNLKTSFELDWDELKTQGQSEGKYTPKLIEKDSPSEKEHGTVIILSKIKRKSNFDPSNLAYSLAKSFHIFDKTDFNVKIFHNNKKIEESPLTNKLRYRDIDEFLKWEFPLKKPEIKSNYKFIDRIVGQLLASKEKTIPEKMRGVALFSRGKLVNDYSFYDVKATSHGYSYITGWLNIDFIEEFDEDVISTNRQSLNWEMEETSELKSYLQIIIRAFYNEQREKKKKKKLEVLEKEKNINLTKWLDKLPKHEKKLAKRISDSILNADGIHFSKSVELIRYTIDSFQFEAFKDLAKELEEVENSETERIVILFKEWELIEAKEMYKLAIGRIETIRTFENLIEINAKEVQQIHPFFEKFPWVLDPRINMFRHELHYAKLLKENYPENELDEKNRRIDFLCTSVSNHKFIIELKRPLHNISLKDINQAKDYRSFVEEHLNTDKYSPNKVIAYIVGGRINNDDRKTRDEIDTMQNADKVYVKTFSQLLTDARRYHQEFIDKYNELEKNV